MSSLLELLCGLHQGAVLVSDLHNTFKIAKSTMCQKANTKSSVKQHWPPTNEGRIRCHGGVSILCIQVKPAVRPWSKLGIRDYPSSKPVWKPQSSKGYETNDLPEYITSTARRFAYDCLVYTQIRNQRDADQLQKDVTSLEEWEQKWDVLPSSKVYCHHAASAGGIHTPRSPVRSSGVGDVSRYDLHTRPTTGVSH
jgi:hypothetical protein